MPTAPRHAPGSSAACAITLICAAHFFSHFNMMLLPPLLPVVADFLQVGYTQIGFALSAYSLVAGLTQAPMGMLVDRHGAAKILIAGVALEGLAFGAMGTAPVFGIFALLLGVAGIANAVYHPANYSILNRVVSQQSIGKAFSYHTAAGLLGEALAPACVLLLASLVGWRIALMLCGAAGLATALIMACNFRLLAGGGTESGPRRGTRATRQLLLSAPVLTGLLFFVGIALTTRGVNGFSVSALHVGRDLSLGTAGTLLSAWLFAAPLGVLTGGQLADRQQHHARLIARCFVVIAASLAALVVFTPGLWISALLFAIGGFASGMVAPSRDMLIRSITPPGKSGVVFGFVSTGFNIGGVLAAPLYGYLLDRGFADGVFWTAALASLLTMATVLSTRRTGTRDDTDTAATRSQR